MSLIVLQNWTILEGLAQGDTTFWPSWANTHSPPNSWYLRRDCQKRRESRHLRYRCYQEVDLSTRPILLWFNPRSDIESLRFWTEPRVGPSRSCGWRRCERVWGVKGCPLHRPLWRWSSAGVSTGHFATPSLRFCTGLSCRLKILYCWNLPRSSSAPAASGCFLFGSGTFPRITSWSCFQWPCSSLGRRSWLGGRVGRGLRRRGRGWRGLRRRFASKTSSCRTSACCPEATGACANTGELRGTAKAQPPFQPSKSQRLSCRS